MSEISERIYKAVQKANLSYSELSQLTSIPKSALQRYATGETEKCPLPRLEAIAKATNVSPAYLMGWADETDDMLNFDNIFPIQTKKIPLLGEIACGEPKFAEQEISCYVECGAEIKADFALRCKGDSMINARINDGDIVFVRRQETVTNGEIAAVVVEDEATLKRVYINQDAIILNAENPAYLPIVITPNDHKNVRILGKAIAFQSDVR